MSPRETKLTQSSSTAIWVVAPITRAVDDKSAKTLLGESFKRQLKFDGMYDRVTFICSKTDEISMMETATCLGFRGRLESHHQIIEKIVQKVRQLKVSVRRAIKRQSTLDRRMRVIDEVRATFPSRGRIDNSQTEQNLKNEVEDLRHGKVIPASINGTQKRKRAAKSQASSRSKKKRISQTGVAVMMIEEDETVCSNDMNDEDAGKIELPKSPAATKAFFAKKVAQVEKRIRTQCDRRVEFRRQLDESKQSTKREQKLLSRLEAEKKIIESRLLRLCLAKRNAYSKTTIRDHFAAGIRELDQEDAQDQDEENFDPDAELRDYEKVAAELPVFCVSSRVYQRMSGRFVREKGGPNFQSLKDTEVCSVTVTSLFSLCLDSPAASTLQANDDRYTHVEL